MSGTTVDPLSWCSPGDSTAGHSWQTQWTSLSSVNLVPLLTPVQVIRLPFLSDNCFPVFAIGIPRRQDQSLPWPLARWPWWDGGGRTRQCLSRGRGHGEPRVGGCQPPPRAAAFPATGAWTGEPAGAGGTRGALESARPRTAASHVLSWKFNYPARGSGIKRHL